MIFLLQLVFLEAAERSDILEDGKLARIHVFRDEHPMMHRDGWDQQRASFPDRLCVVCLGPRFTKGRPRCIEFRRERHDSVECPRSVL